MKKISRNKGFTLIELLVVIAIIGALTSVVIPSLNSTRIKARDVVRKESLNQLSKALESYYADNGKYPIGTFFSMLDSGQNTDCWCGKDGNQTFKNSIVMTNYIQTLPSDPSNIDYSYLNSISAGTINFLGYGPSRALAYIYFSDNGKRYILGTNLESEGMPTGVTGIINSDSIQRCTLYGNYQISNGNLVGLSCPVFEMEG